MAFFLTFLYYVFYYSIIASRLQFIKMSWVTFRLLLCKKTNLLRDEIEK